MKVNRIESAQEIFDMFMTSNELYQKRMNICETCPSYTQIDADKNIWVCGECGCDMVIKNKYKNTKCPLKKF